MAYETDGATGAEGRVNLNPSADKAYMGLGIDRLSSLPNEILIQILKDVMDRDERLAPIDVTFGWIERPAAGDKWKTGILRVSRASRVTRLSFGACTDFA